MPALTPPYLDGATVDVPDEHVDRYVEAGWQKVKAPAKRSESKQSKSEK